MTRLTATPAITDPTANGGRIPCPAFIRTRRAMYSGRGIVALEIHHPALTPVDRNALQKMRGKVDNWDRGGAHRRKVEARNQAEMAFTNEVD